jgi:N4-gp56 family major capsid protein
MAVTNTSDLNDLLPAITAEALFVASEKSIMRGLVRNYTIPAGQGKTVTVPIYPKQTATGLTEATAGNQVTVSTSGATLTVSEVGLYATVSDLALMASNSNVVADLGRLFGEAIARKMDTDLMALFMSFATNTLGGTTTAATPALIFQAIAKLRSQGYDTSNDCAIVLHPNVAYDVASTLTSTFAAPASAIGNAALENGFMGMLGGVPVYQSSLVPLETGSAAAGDYACGIFHKDALGLAMMKDVTIETQRQAAARGYDIVGSAIYGVGELYDNAGVRAIFDSSIE